MSQQLFPPLEVRMRRSTGVVEIVWRNGEASRFSGDALRRFCACAHCRARNTVGLRLVGESDEVARVALMGSVGLQVVFADGHDRGVFPWDYLRRIAEEEQRSSAGWVGARADG